MSGEQPNNGFMSGIQGFETKVPLEQFGSFALNEFIRKNQTELQKNDTYLGTWIDQGNVFMDISKKFEDEKTALEFGIQNNQLAIFNLTKNETINAPALTYR